MPKSTKLLKPGRKPPVKKPAKPQVRDWNKVEDFYVTLNLGRLSVANIAFDLERTVPEVTQRIADLNLSERAAQIEKDSRLKGFHTQNGVVSMTATRSMSDDRSTGTQPSAVTDAAAEARKKAGLPAEADPQTGKPNAEFNEKYQKNVHKIW